MKQKKYITLGFASVSLAVALLLSTNIFASSIEEQKKR